MKRVFLLALVGLMLVGSPAAAQQWFDFNGQVLLPPAVGQDLMFYGVINNNGQIDTPIPLDFGAAEYTIVVTGLTFITDGFTQSYAGGLVTIFADAGTAADYGSLGTFMDGDIILSGELVTLDRTMFTANLGSASGSVNWTGGSRLDEIAPADRLSWAFVASISNRSTVTEPGYDENWNGKVEPQDPIVATDEASWGDLKSNY